MKELFVGSLKYVKAGVVSFLAGGFGAYFSSALTQVAHGITGAFELDFVARYYEVPTITLVATIFLWWALRHKLIWAVSISMVLCVVAFAVASMMRHEVWLSDDTVTRFFIFVIGVVQLGILSIMGAIALLKRTYDELETAGLR